MQDYLVTVQSVVQLATFRQQVLPDKHQVSTGVAGRLGKMNVPSVLNSAYRPFLGWEGKATSLEEQILRAMHGFPELDMSKEEMGRTVKSKREVSKAVFNKLQGKKKLN
ncbi:c-type cytochrome [Biomphalaria pfeifferi]|uniref:C-type cytochrome n=1 Tax=Biomphalaria pfeifferi TaxID=112525 RepID=A0AAD8AMM1_BIOPF|nr:c-type cytochrome [Biomphalaria pfeifferi]